jgi:hypothetical protein
MFLNIWAEAGCGEHSSRTTPIHDPIMQRRKVLERIDAILLPS